MTGGERSKIDVSFFSLSWTKGMKLSFPSEVYCSFFSFFFSFALCTSYSLWRDFATDAILATAAHFVIITALSVAASALILHQVSLRRSSLIDDSFRLRQMFSVAWRAGLLGGVFGFGLYLSNNESLTVRPFGVYLCILSFFHWSEYFTTAVSSSETLTLDSFLLNHSFEYWAAASLSWLEFALECYFCPLLKSFPIVTWVGVVLCVVGEGFRKLAMLTAGRNFTHLIQYQKRHHHELVTHGVYSLFRHPSYVGWFWWSVGTQVTLCNPFCTAIYAFISWRFFKDRIYHEEITLINFFGEQYVEYQNRVPTGLPGISGFQPY